MVTVLPLPDNVMLLPPLKNSEALFVALNVDVPAVLPASVMARNCVDCDVMPLCDPTMVWRPPVPVDNERVTPFWFVNARRATLPDVAASLTVQELSEVRPLCEPTIVWRPPVPLER